MNERRSRASYGVFCFDYFEENLPRYGGIALYSGFTVWILRLQSLVQPQARRCLQRGH